MATAGSTNTGAVDPLHELADLCQREDMWMHARTDGQVNFFDRGVQLTRGFRALKLWMTIKVFGLAALRRAVEHGIRIGEYAERALRDAGWEIVTPAQLAIVSFRRELPGATAADLDRRHLDVVAQMQADGVAAVSSTVLHGITVLRMCTINPRTTSDDIDAAVASLGRAWEAGSSTATMASRR